MLFVLVYPLVIKGVQTSAIGGRRKEEIMNTSFDTWKAQATKTLDVRPDLARGDEPFVRIMEAAEATRPGEVLAIICAI